jgi:hypothetical protein
MLLRYCLSDYEMFLAALLVTGIVFISHSTCVIIIIMPIIVPKHVFEGNCKSGGVGIYSSLLGKHLNAHRINL